MASEPYVLRVEGARKSFGRRTVLKAASLWVEPGKITTLMGRNGSGKTTLLRIAAGVLTPEQGVVEFRGKFVGRPRLPALARRGLMYVPQEWLVVPHWTVRAHFEGLAEAFPASTTSEAIDQCDLREFMNRTAGSLSGGEQARVSLALALARRPVVLLVDEPLAGLSPTEQERLGALMRVLAAEGIGVVTSGHDARALLAISDVILWSVAGTTHYIGTPDEALDHHQFRREYLGPGFAGPGQVGPDLRRRE